MADEDPKLVRTFTEQEAYALVADNVQRETAARQATIDSLTSEKASLEQKLELAEAGLATQTVRADGAIAWHEAVLAGIETEKAQLARSGDRVAKVKEAAPHLKDDFFTPERAERWARQDDEAFNVYVNELKELSTGVAPGAGEAGPPRETAMAGAPVVPVAGAAGGGSLLGQLLGGPKTKGA